MIRFRFLLVLTRFLIRNVHCITTNLEEEMPNLKWAKQAKAELQIPVSVVSAVMTPAMADEIISKGYVDMVAFGRTLLADPYWPKKAMEGHPEDIVPCLRCSNCYHISSDHWNVGCSVNPRYHHQEFVPSEINLQRRRQKTCCNSWRWSGGNESCNYSK